MAYSTFERPKLHNVKSLKFYPEEHNHHVSFRHKNLPPNFDLSVEKHQDRRNHSIDAHSSTYKRSPIYVHTFDTFHQNEGDFVLKTDKKKSKTLNKSVIDKLEEKYWANWKPDKKSPKSPKMPVFKNEKIPDIKIIKSAPERRRRINKTPSNKSKDSQIKSSYRLQKNTSKCQEIQTDDLPSRKEEGVQSEDKIDKEPAVKEDKPETNSGEGTHEQKFLKHTDSMILNHKKQKEESKEERFEQPKCIRLYRKSGKLPSKSYIRGGSYPLKSCLKKETTMNKAKLGRPGSPVIVSSNYSNKNAKNHHKR